MAVVLWVVVPIAAVHLALQRWRPQAFRFQLLLDLVLLTLFGRALVLGLDLNPVRALQGTPPYTSWRWDDHTRLQPTQSDLVRQLHPWWEEERRQLRTGRVPLVAPHIGGGAPLLGNGQSGLLAPVMAPVWALGPERGTTVMAVWKVEAAALGAFLFLTVAWRLRPFAAGVGALAWGAGPFIMAWLLSPLAWSLAALPWVWWLVAGAVARRARWRAVIAAGALSGWLMGAGINPESAAIVVGSGLLAAVVLHPRRWLRVVAMAVLAALVAAALAWPALVTIAASSKARTYAAENPNLRPVPWPLRRAALVQTALPAGLGHPGRGTWRGPYPYAAGALGVGGAALALLLAGRVRRRHRRLLLAALACLAVAAVLAFRAPPLDWLLVRLPVVRFMTLTRFGLLVPWSLAVWAALAAGGGLSGSRLRRAAALLVIAALAVAAVLLAGPGWAWADLALALSTGVAAALGSVLLVRRPGWLPALAAVELVLLGAGINPTAAAADCVPTPPVLARLLAEHARVPGRIVAVGGVLPANLASRYGLTDLRSFDPVRPWPLARLHALLGATDPVLPGPLTWAPPRLLGAWSVRYLVTPAGAEAPGWTPLARISHRRVKRSAGGVGDGGVFDPTGAESYSAVRRAPGGEKTPPAPVHRALQPRGGEKGGLDAGDGVAVWSNPSWQPEVRVAGKTMPLPEDDGWRLLAEDPELLLNTVVTPPNSAEAAATEATLEIVTRTPDRLSVRTACNGPCLLVLAQPWAPGWGASVDGRRAPVVRANLAGLGVLAPRGVHSVDLRYRPW